MSFEVKVNFKGVLAVATLDSVLFTTFSVVLVYTSM